MLILNFLKSLYYDVHFFILGDNMNVFLNENWNDVLTELLPAVEDIFGTVFRDMGRQFTSRIPMNQIFLE